MKIIKTTARVFKLADTRKSVINVRQNKARPMPAAIVQNYPARVLHNMVKGGCLAEYTPKPKAKKKFPKSFRRV